MLLVDELQQLALAHHRVVQVEAGEFVLPALEDPELFDEPVIQRTVHLELEGTDGMRDLFDRVALSVREVVHRIDAPGVAGAVVMHVLDPIEDRVAEVHVRRSHVDLRAQGTLAIAELPVLHALEQVEVLLHAAAAVGRSLSGFGRRAFHGSDLLRGAVVDVGQAFPDQGHRELVQLAEVIARIELVRPLIAEPLDVALDALDVLGLFLLGIGVVEAQVGLAVEFLCEAEVHVDRLRVADVQVAVRLRGETREYASAVLAGSDVFADDLFEEIQGFIGGHDR